MYTLMCATLCTAMCAEDKDKPLSPPKLRGNRVIMSEKELEGRKVSKEQQTDKTKRGEMDR